MDLVLSTVLYGLAMVDFSWKMVNDLQLYISIWSIGAGKVAIALNFCDIIQERLTVYISMQYEQVIKHDSVDIS